MAFHGWITNKMATNNQNYINRLLQSMTDDLSNGLIDFKKEIYIKQAYPVIYFYIKFPTVDWYLELACDLREQTIDVTQIWTVSNASPSLSKITHRIYPRFFLDWVRNNKVSLPKLPKKPSPEDRRAFFKEKFLFVINGINSSLKELSISAQFLQKSKD